MNVLRTFWSEALQIAAYLINGTPSLVLSHKFPLDILFPNMPLFALPPKTFGCICYVHVPKSIRTKLDPKASVFLGYGVNQKGYKCYHAPTRWYFVSQDVTFFESIPYFFARGASSQGEQCVSNELIGSNSLPLPTPIPVPVSQFDG